MKEYTKESLVEALLDIRARGWIVTHRKNNDGGIGNTLEDLLDIPENNLPLPNAAEWELKAQKKNTSSLLTLFHMEPSPRAFKIVPRILLPIYGWPHAHAGGKYPETERSFRQTIRAGRFSDRGFTVLVAHNERKVSVKFDYAQIDLERHAAWATDILAKAGPANLDPIPYWGFDDLFHKAGVKLGNCFLVQATAKKIDDELCFRYEDIYMLSGFSLDRFIEAIEVGNIYIDFDARTKHNHGTKFRIRRKILPELYRSVERW